MVISNTNNKRIAKNSLFLYFRTLIVMIVTLFTSRVILKSLGVEDYGIYNVVGGIASMFSIISGSMTDATQRFLTIEIGKRDDGNPNKVFSTSLQLHVLIGIIIVLVAEPIGLWFLYNKLIIPAERMSAAFWVFQCSLFSLFVLVVSIPYNALIVAHERMKAFAYFSVIDAFLRLFVAYLVAINLGIDKLIIYALLMLLSPILLVVLYYIYCRKNFEESKYQYAKDSTLVKEFGNFAMWSMLGNISYVCSNYGVNLLLGTFFEPFVNAARGISLQVQGAFSTFVKNFQTAVNPQITKNYAAGYKDEMFDLIFRGARISFLLILIPVIPILLETDIILSLWLKTVPEFSADFIRIMIVTALISTLRNPLEVAIKASGRIKIFEIAVYGSKLLILPCSYLCLYMGASPVSVFIVTLVFEAVAFIISLIEIERLVGLSFMAFIKNVVYRLLFTIFVAIPIPIIVRLTQDPDVYRFFILTISSVVITIICAIYFGLTRGERTAIFQFVKNKVKAFI